MALVIGLTSRISNGQEAEATNDQVVQRQNVVINEVMPSNGRSLVDQDGEPSDWIELYNPTNQPVDLGGWYLSDDQNKLAKWPIPADTWLQPGEFLVIWAQARIRVEPSCIPASIDQEGETLFLVNGDGSTIIDHVEVPALKLTFLTAASLMPVRHGFALKGFRPARAGPITRR